MKKYDNRYFLKFIYPMIFILFSINVAAQVNRVSKYYKDSLLTAAKEIMIEAHFCALITLDENGKQQARTMDPFSPEDDFTVWMGTNINSEKVKEIRNNSAVTLYYQSSDGSGYAVILGNAILVQDSVKKAKYWKKEWERFYSENREDYILIKATPVKLEVLNYKRSIEGDSKTWAAPSVDFKLDD